MAGTKTGDFIELITPFLRGKMRALELAHGMNSAEWRAIALQYVKNPLEAAISPQERRRHYESEVGLQFQGKPLVGVERLYRRTVLLRANTAEQGWTNIATLQNVDAWAVYFRIVDGSILAPPAADLGDLIG